MKRLLAPALFALAGFGVLIALFPRVHPSAVWGFVYDRAKATAMARDFAERQGLATGGWTALMTADFGARMESYRRRYPDDRAAKAINPASAHVVLASPDKQRAFSVHFDPAGKVTAWERKEPRRPLSLPGPDMLAKARAAAGAAFLGIAGEEASGYRLTTPGAPTRDGLRFTWERSTPGPRFQPTVDVIVRGGEVVHAETHLHYDPEFEAAYTREGAAVDWSRVAYFVLYFAMAIAGAVLYTLGTIQRKVAQGFALAFTLVNSVFVIAALAFGPNPQEFFMQEAMNNEPVWQKFYGSGFGLLASFLLAAVMAGAGLFASGAWRAKWWTVRLFLSRRVASRPVGSSVSAGTLWGMGMAALPVLAAAMAPGAQWNHPGVREMFSPFPVFQAWDYPLHPTVVGFFGVVFAFAMMRIRSKPTLNTVILVLGVLFFLGSENQFQSPLSANLLLGTLTFLAYLLLFRWFDLLAVLFAATSKTTLLLASAMLLQPSPALRTSGWELVAAWVCLLISGLALRLKAVDLTNDEQPETEPLAQGIRPEREELKSEFGVAQRAQREMLPSTPPSIPGFSLAAHCTPAREVGGDLYDFLPMANGRMAIAVADVSGKGVPAALYMTLTKGLLAAATQDDLELSVLMEQINRHLYAVGRRKTFVTMALSVLDPAGRTLQYARAGHNPAVWRRPKQASTSLLNSRGMGLGITGGQIFRRSLTVDTLNLEAGDTLVFYSDGLTEAMNPALEQFGEERLLEVSARLDGLSAAQSRDAILAEVTAFLGGNHPQDDLTLVVLRVE